MVVECDFKAPINGFCILSWISASNKLGFNIRCPLLDIKACGRHVLRVLRHNPRVLNQLAKPVDDQGVHIRKDEPSYEDSKENRWIQFLFVIVATIVAPISCCLDSIFKLIIGFVLVWNDSP